nr:MAG TPA: protein of unknown function (DUF4094) [Caudoviricetes sp.]
MNTDTAIANLADVQDWLAQELAEVDQDYRYELAEAIMSIDKTISTLVQYQAMVGADD